MATQMVGRFHPDQHILHGTHKIMVAGSLDPDVNQLVAGDRVTIEVTKLSQNGHIVACHRTFTIHNPEEQLNWEMEVSASHFAAGMADGAATATLERTGDKFSWTAPANPNPNPPPDPTPRLQIVQD